MADILENIKAALEGPIDFPSQKWTEDTATLVLQMGTVIACFMGYSTQRIDVLLVVFVFHILIALLWVCPPWPQFKKEELKWVEPKVPTFE